MSILITGGGSLLMRETARILVGRGEEVVSLQRRKVEGLDGVRQVLGDVRSRESVIEALQGCDAVVHGAARVGVSGTWADFWGVNVEGTRSVGEAAKNTGIERMVHVSTPSVAHVGEPLVGAGAGGARTGRAGAFYAESKAHGETLALGLNDAGFGVVAVRPHLVWGPGDPQLVGRIVSRARAGRLLLVGEGAALVETTYVEDAARSLVAALDSVRPGSVCAGRAYVVAGGEPRTVREMVEAICGAAGVAFEPRNIPYKTAVRAGRMIENVWAAIGRGEPPITEFVAEQLGTAHWFDPRPAREDLSWRPVVGIDEGLRRLAEWYGGGDQA